MTGLEIKMNQTGSYVGIEKNGMKLTKAVDTVELISTLQSQAAYDFGLLPPNTRGLTVGGNSFVVAIEIPPGNRDISIKEADLDKVVIEKVPLPPFLMVFHLIRRDDAYYHNNSYIFAMGGDRLVFPNEKLYAAPLPNVHPDNRICWGHNDLKGKLKTLAAVGDLARLFFSAPTNSDLFDTTRLAPNFPWKSMQARGSRSYDAATYFKYLVNNGLQKEWLRPLKAEFEDFTKAMKHIGR